MNFSNILAHIAETDPEVYERTSQRRSVIRNWMRGVTLATVPLALGGMFKKAYGQSIDPVIEALNFALVLEYLERDFYKAALDVSLPPFASANPLIPAATGLEQPAFVNIYNHEVQHVAFLTRLIEDAGGTIAPKPNFDFTGGKGTPNGSFPNVFSDYNDFLAVAQTLEDTGVRAYKTAAPVIMAQNDMLTSVMRIHSVEARHAAHIRELRRLTPSNMVDGDVKPWITGKKSNIMSNDVQKSYDGEENTLQGTIQIIDINGQKIGEDPASEAFDEPLSVLKVLEIIDPFIVVP